MRSIGQLFSITEYMRTSYDKEAQEKWNWFNFDKQEEQMERELTEDEITECKKAFDVFDQNKDGRITTAELTQVLRSLGSLPSEEEIQGLIEYFDLNNNGTIEFPEFLNMVARKVLTSNDSEKQTKKAFRAFDKNGDGFITASELKEAMINLGENLTDEEVGLEKLT